MNRRNLLLTTAKTAILAAFGRRGGARGETPAGRRALPVTRAPAAARGRRTVHNGKNMQSYAAAGRPYYSSGTTINILKDSTQWGDDYNVYLDRKDENGYIKNWQGLSYVTSLFRFPANMPGRYVLRGKGAGSISMASPGPVVPIDTIHLPGNYAKPGHSDYEWEITTRAIIPKNWSDISRLVIGQGFDYPNHIRDLVLMHEDHVEDYDAGRRFPRESIELLRQGIGYNRMLDNTSNFTFCANKSEWVPEGSYSWNQWFNTKHWTGTAVRDDLTHFSVPDPSSGYRFTEKYMDHISLNMPVMPSVAGPYSPYHTVPVESREAVGKKTKLTLVNDGKLALPELVAGAHVSLSEIWPVPSMAFDANRIAGFKIEARDDSDPTRPVLTLDFDSSADPPADLGWGVGDGGKRVRKTQARAVPFIRIGGGRHIPVDMGWWGQWGDQVRFFVLHFDKTRDGWIASSADRVEMPCVLHPSILLRMCNEIGCHPWFSTPYLAADAYVRSPGELPVKENMSDHVREYATEVRDYVQANAPWMVPVFEPPNETWNPMFPGTQFAFKQGYMRKSPDHNLVSGQADQWYATVTSLIGQTIAEVFGAQEHEVRTQNRYRMVSSYWTSVQMHEQISRDSAGKITDFSPAERRFGKGDWFSEHGGSPAYKWCTDISYTTYYSPPIYDTTWERRMAELWDKDRAPGGPYQYLVDFYASSEVNFPEPWEAGKQYRGPRKDGTVDVVYDFEPGGQLYAYVALRDSIGVRPNTSRQDGYGGQGEDDPNNHWWRAQGDGRGGYLKQVYENAALFASNPQWGTVPGGGTGIGMMPYEGGWSPDFGSDALLNAFRRETNRATTLRQCAFRNYQLNHEAGLKHNIARGAGINPSEFSFAGDSIWSVWFGGLGTHFFDQLDPARPPRWLAMLDWNAQTPPPPRAKVVPSLKTAPEQASKPAKAPGSIPSWCQGLNHPNANACGSEHAGGQ